MKTNPVHVLTREDFSQAAVSKVRDRPVLEIMALLFAFTVIVFVVIPLIWFVVVLGGLLLLLAKAGMSFKATRLVELRQMFHNHKVFVTTHSYTYGVLTLLVLVATIVSNRL